MNNKEFLLGEFEKLLDFLKNFHENKEKYHSVYDIKELKNIFYFNSFQSVREFYCFFNTEKGHTLYEKSEYNLQDIIELVSSDIQKIEQQENIPCLGVIFPSCNNCAFCCDGEYDMPCKDWKPCRFAHPSILDTCELSCIKDYDLCLNICEFCEYCLKE